MDLSNQLIKNMTCSLYQERDDHEEALVKIEKFRIQMVSVLDFLDKQETFYLNRRDE